MSVWGYILAIFFIVGSGVAGSVFLNWQQLKSFWNRIASRTYVMLAPKNLIRHVFKFYGWSVFYWGKRRIRNSVSWCKKCAKYFWSWCWRLFKLVIRIISKISLFGLLVFVFLALLIAFGLLFGWFLLSFVGSLYIDIATQIDGVTIGSPAFRNVSLSIAGSITLSIAALGVILTVIRNLLTRQQNKTDEERLVTEQISRAIDQVGAYKQDIKGERLEPNIEVRLGGLYSLQRIMQNSRKDEDSIAKIFYAYVRENAKKVEKGTIEETKKDLHRWQKKRYPREDVQAALDIINQFNEAWRNKNKNILNDIQINFARSNFSGYSFTDKNFSNFVLEGVDLSHATLTKANLSHATLIEANLTKANLTKANLTKVNLSGADLTDTDLTNADLTNADLTGANLIGADLIGADLSGADLYGADLTGANLHGADLFYAKNLKQDQLEKADGDEETEITYHVTRPKHWKNSEADDIDDETWDAFE